MGLLMAQAILGRTESQVAQRWTRQAAIAGKPTRRAANPAKVYVNYGRCLIDCDCGASVAVQQDWQHAHCLDCLTEYDVLWPGHEKWAAIETLLGVRPLVANRNWNQQETLAELVAENLAHGLPAIDIPEGEE